MPSPLEFYAAASASPARRETLWRGVRDARDADGGLKLALLQSLPGHSGYDPVQARRRLLAIARGDGDDGALARVRLAELNAAAECRAETQAMQQRLNKIVDIERSLDGNGHAKTPNPAR
ncbi:MAG: hypothetical protein ACREVL_02295 [Solimonas sp.]